MENHWIVWGLALVCVACAHNETKEWCLENDWEAEGAVLGTLGIEAQAESAETKCREFHLPVDKEKYMRGWRNAIGDYCSPKNAYELALKGTEEPTVCPEELKAKFHESYATTLKVMNLEAKAALVLQRSSTTKSALSGTTDARKKKALRQEMAQLEKELNQLRTEYRKYFKNDCYGFLGCVGIPNWF